MSVEKANENKPRNMFKLGDILVDESLSCEVLVIAIEKGYYRTRHISGILDTGSLRIYDPQPWYIIGNIFEKEVDMEEKKHCKWYNDEFCTNDKSPCVADYCPVVEYPELCKHRETEEKELTANDILEAVEKLKVGEDTASKGMVVVNFNDLNYVINGLQDKVDHLNGLNTELLQERAELQKQVDEFTEVFGNADNFARIMSDLRMSNGNRISTSTELCEWVKQQIQQPVKDTAWVIWNDCIDKIMRGCGDDKEFWVIKILIETFKKFGVGFEVE